MKIIKNIPNILSLSRVPLAFVFVFAFFEDGGGVVSLAVLAVAGLTDVFDGLIARGFGLTSEAGKIIDPGADKFLQCVVMICMCINGYVPLWLATAYVFKETVFVILSVALLEKRNAVIQSNVFGKITTALYYVFISILLLVPKVSFEYPILYDGMCINLALMLLLSAAVYFVNFTRAARASE